MKKLFTLMAAVLLSILGTATANAQEEVDITGRVGYCWGGDEESFTFNEDGSITYNSKTWGGLAMWIGGEDWSMYGSITYEFAEPVPVSGQINFMAEAGNPSQWFNAGQTSVTLNFSDLDVTQVNQIALQASDVAVIQIKRIYLTTAVIYEDKGVSLPIGDGVHQFLPASLFAGFSQNAKVVFTVDVAGSADFPGWGIGEVITPHLTKDENWQVVEGIMVLEVKGGTDGTFTYSKTIKDLIPALTNWPDDNTGEYGLYINMYGQGGGTCTATVKSIEVIEEVGVEPTDAEIVLNSGDDIGAALFAATMGTKMGKLTVHLPSDGAVSINNTIYISDDLTINGEGATIDASGLNGPFIQMKPIYVPAAAAPHHAAPENLMAGAAYIGEIALNDFEMVELKNQLVYANKNQYLVGKIAVNNCNINVNGSKKTIFDFNGGGNTNELNINNSTIYGGAEAQWQNGGFFSSQGSKEVTELGGDDQTQNFVITNSTLYNVVYGKTTSTLRKNSQKYQKFQVKNSVIANSGKNAQFLKGLNAGQAGKDDNWEVSGNAFNFDGEDIVEQNVGATDGNVKNSVAGVIAFADPESGNFALANCAQLHAKIGDPRWIDAKLESLSADLTKEVVTATALLGDTDPESFDEAYRLKIAITEAESLLQSLSINTTTYQETFDNLKVAEAKFIEATRPHYYIIGNAANGWSRTEIPEMVYNDKTQRYEYELTTTDKDYFAIVDKVLTPDEDAADADWSDFNTNHRYALAEGDQEAKIEEEMQLIKVNGTLVLNAAGTYYLSMDKDLKLTIIKAPEVEEITVAKALEIIAALEDGAKTDTEYKVKGFVVGDPDFQRKADETLYGNVNLNMADEKDGTTTLTVFRAKSYDNEAFTEETISLIKAGDEVVFQGKLQKYVKEGVTTPELVSGWLISVTSSGTGIKAISADVTDGAWYTIQGVRVAQPTKGVFIHNGKKVVIK